MKKIIAFFVIFVLLCTVATVHSCTRKESVVILTSGEDYIIEFMQKRFKEKFTDFNVEIVYTSTSNITTKVIEEGEGCEADIIFEQEYAQLEKIVESGRAASFNGRYDLSIFEDDMVLDSMKDSVLPTIRSGEAVIINNKVLKSRGLEKPTCYEDLLKPEFKGLISMPSPVASSTGYAFYLALVNAMGEEKALDYFSKLATNVIQFTDSGSGPVNNLCMEEVAVGLGMTSQAVEKINSGRTELEILNFEEGAPYALYGTMVVAGKETKKSVMQVMDYFYSDLINEICERYYPEKVFKGVRYNVENFPDNIKYGDMSGNTLERKEYLLSKWRF